MHGFPSIASAPKGRWSRSPAAALLFGAALYGCATTPERTEVATPATAASSPAKARRFAKQNQAQATRIRELEARLALLEAESRGQRDGGALAETVRIGRRSDGGRRDEQANVASRSERPLQGASDGRSAKRARPEPAPIRLRLYGRKQHSSSPEAVEPLPVVAERLPVVPLPDVADSSGAWSPVGVPAAERPSGAGAKQAYLAALRHLKGRAYQQAGDAFALFVADHPQHPLADSARYWLAEARYAQRDYARALSLFDQLLAHAPRGRRAPAALHKAGLCHQRLGNDAAARRYFARLVAQFPDSAAVAALPTASVEALP